MGGLALSDAVFSPDYHDWRATWKRDGVSPFPTFNAPPFTPESRAQLVRRRLSQRLRSCATLLAVLAATRPELWWQLRLIVQVFGVCRLLAEAVPGPPRRREGAGAWQEDDVLSRYRLRLFTQLRSSAAFLRRAGA